MVRINPSEATARLPDLIDAALKGEEVIISEDGRDVVQGVPVAPRRRQFGSARGLVVLSDDFDAPLSGFDAYSVEYSRLPGEEGHAVRRQRQRGRPVPIGDCPGDG
jgi:antitoxin (DNA-binding transcriptional repressor) of toxin-antitoxin stability system